MPDKSSYVYSSDGYLQMRRNKDDEDSWLTSSRDLPTEAQTQNTNETPYTTNTANWIELTRASTSNSSLSPPLPGQPKPESNQDDGFSAIYSTQNLMQDPSSQTMDPSLLFQRNLFASNITSNIGPPSPHMFPPPPSPSPLTWQTPSAHQLSDMEAAALYRIAMPRGSMNAEEKAALYRIAMPQGPAPTHNASISALESSTTSTSPLAVTSPSSSRVSSRPSESGPSSLRPSAKHTLDANDDGRGNSKRRDHNAIEKKYRDNINERFRELRECVPSLRGMQSRNAEGKGKGKGKEKERGKERDDDGKVDGVESDRDADGAGEDEDDLEGLEPAHKFNKATIIIKAIEYIRHLEAKQRRSQVQERAMRERIEAFERLFSARPV